MHSQVLLKSSVKEVTSTTITLNDGSVVPFGIAVWAAGIGPLPLTLDLIQQVLVCARAHCVCLFSSLSDGLHTGNQIR